MPRRTGLAASLAFGLAACMSAALSGAQAQAGPVLAELFTSQGCSSCPPADAVLGELAQREDVIALALHVDYWDYIGWRDTFGAPANTARQRAYAAAMGRRSVFTPELVVDGLASTVGSRRREVEAAIAAAAARPDPVRVDIAEEGGALSITLTPEIASEGRGRVLLFVYERPQTVAIGRGENRNRRITYHNVVRTVSEIGRWRGARMTLRAPRPAGARGVAVVAQRASGAVLGAARLEFDAGS